MCGTRKMNLFNVVPVFGDKPEFTVSEILRQKEEAGIDKVALCLSYHPQCTPAANLIPRLCGLFKTVKAGVEGHGIELGVLIQSTQGHGWNGKVPLTQEPWQQIIELDGKVSPRMCMLDPGFYGYIQQAITETVKAGAAFLLIDDDFGLRYKECFCPRHLKMYGEALGREVTREELEKMCAERPVDDPEVLKLGEVRMQNVLTFADQIRSAIDAVDPSIRCGMCTPFNGYGFVGPVALHLAGKTEPFIRINCAVYGMQAPSALYNASDMIWHVKHYIGDSVKDLVAESDTFNQNYYSESARLFHAHVTNGFLCGLNGSKLWTSEFNNPVDTSSQKRYEEKLLKNKGLYAELLKIMTDATWEGIAAPLYKVKTAMHPAVIAAQAQSNWIGCWQNPLVGSYSFPITYAEPGKAAITAVTKYDVDNMSDTELDALFTRGVLIDSHAAITLTERGYAKLMGVEASRGDADFHFTHEYNEEQNLSASMMWDESMAELKPLSDETKAVTWLCRGPARSATHEKVAPGTTFFTNEKGGRVAVTAWTPEQPYYKTMRPVRREWLQLIFDFLNGSTLEMGLDNADQQMLVRHNKLTDGRELLSIINLNLDELDELIVHLTRTPAYVEKLMPDGSWKEVPFARKNALQLTISEPVKICDPLILRFTF